MTYSKEKLKTSGLNYSFVSAHCDLGKSSHKMFTYTNSGHLRHTHSN